MADLRALSVCQQIGVSTVAQGTGKGVNSRLVHLHGYRIGSQQRTGNRIHKPKRDAVRLPLADLVEQYRIGPGAVPRGMGDNRGLPGSSLILRIIGSCIGGRGLKIYHTSHRNRHRLTSKSCACGGILILDGDGIRGAGLLRFPLVNQGVGAGRVVVILGNSGGLSASQVIILAVDRQRGRRLIGSAAARLDFEPLVADGIAVLINEVYRDNPGILLHFGVLEGHAAVPVGDIGAGVGAQIHVGTHGSHLRNADSLLAVIQGKRMSPALSSRYTVTVTRPEPGTVKVVEAPAFRLIT